jgi:ubiquinone/menaquinone biosynthesis C-methylase UbiE
MNTQLTLNDHKRWVAASFDQASANYDAYARRYHSLSAKRLVEILALTEGQKTLDIGTGTGAAAIAAAQFVGTEGQSIGIDISESMLKKAKTNAKAAGLNNVEFYVGDAENLDFEDNSFDAVLCCSSLTYMQDYSSTLLEWKRVTKPGEKVAFTSYIYEKAFQPIAMMARDRLSKYGVPLPYPNELIDTPDKCYDLLASVGLDCIIVSTEQFGYYLPNAHEWWDCAWHSPLGYQLHQLELAQINQFKSEHIQEIESLATSQGIWLDVPVIFAVGRKPLA